MAYEITDAPEGLENFIIYEIATKNFTSPDGPESGTFFSLEEKLPYLKELGINVIWLTGHQHCRNRHFYNIWTQYACIRPDRLDPDLGTEEQFKHMIECAHSHGMKVILDVITHGVMKDSPLTEEHPEWFSGESWGMMDYDWYGGHADLDDWWVHTWIWYIQEFGIDGYRLDVAHYRNDLWALIRKKAAAIGKNIMIMAESGPAIKGVTDILQHGEVVSHNYGVNHSSRLLYDAAGYIKDRQMRAGERYDVKIFYQDKTVQDSRENTWYQENKVPEVIWEDAITETEKCDSSGTAYQLQRGRLRVENIYGEKAIHNIQIYDRQRQVWNSRREDALEVDYHIIYHKKRNRLTVEFPLRIQDGQFMSIQLSCHDNGWDGFPAEENPYGAKGSRYLAGYTALLAPGVPVFMSGEEFNADYRPLPELSPKLFGEEMPGENMSGEEMPGQGRWLYGSWIDWEQLQDSDKADMLADMKCLIQIRKTYSNLIHAFRMGEEEPDFGALDYESTAELPVPYFYRNEDRILVICANPDADRDVSVCLNMQDILGTGTCWQVQALYGVLPDGSETAVIKTEEMCDLQWNIKRDQNRQGGLLVLKFEKADMQVN